MEILFSQKTVKKVMNVGLSTEDIEVACIMFLKSKRMCSKNAQVLTVELPDGVSATVHIEESLSSEDKKKVVGT